MWWLGFILHEAGLHLLLIFLPLYVVAIGGSLIDVGVMCMLGQLSIIPASVLWGYLCDRTRRYKIFILLSFLSLAMITYSLALVSSISLLIILYVLLSIFHSAHSPPRNVLIAELYVYEEWKRNFAVFEGFTEVGRFAGLLVGIIVSSGRVDVSIMILCCTLQLLAFISSILLVKEPILILERRLVAIRKIVDFIDEGVNSLCRALDGFSSARLFKGRRVKAFYCGLTLFQMATATLFTPLPIFLLRELGLQQSSIFMMYALNSMGTIACYFYLTHRSDVISERSALLKATLLRSAAALLLPAVYFIPFNTLFVAVLLILLGYLYALFNVCTLTISMELLPPRRAGLFDAMVNLGSVCGAFTGPLIAEIAGFNYVFLLSGATFLSSFVAFKAFNR